jgi:HD-GYP domain-containing protein (c-di-GMP phosphodiesterase class II)
LASPYADADADATPTLSCRPKRLVGRPDRWCQGHWAAAVSRWSAKTGARLGLDQPARHRTAAAARLHDIGKVGISQALLSMPDGPNAEECEEIRRHPVEGARLLVELGNRSDLAPLVAAHHERFDGLGYPYGLAGADIPLEARIIAVCDAWAMIRANRWSARNRTRSESKEEITLGRGTRFDPVVVDAFIALVDEGLIEEPGPLSRS